MAMIAAVPARAAAGAAAKKAGGQAAKKTAKKTAGTGAGRTPKPAAAGPAGGPPPPPPAAPDMAKDLLDMKAPAQKAGRSAAQAVKSATLKPPRRLSARDASGFAFGLVLYALALSAIKYGAAGPKGWLSAKFLNKVTLTEPPR